ncbi:MAG: L-cysteine S-thiosulfotransferase [Thiomicrorhabdus sp.]|nr:MAG: L-cysteine S-thiosulfotransferase [Thiomicrorhabdus sp.]
MHSKMKQLLTALAISTAVISAPTSAFAAGSGASTIDQGKKLVFSRSKGNCLACHAIAGGQQAGNIGPALIAMKLRYPDKQNLVNKISGTSDSQTVPNSMMPPFGKHGILSDSEINKIADFIYTL